MALSVAIPRIPIPKPVIEVAAPLTRLGIPKKYPPANMTNRVSRIPMRKRACDLSIASHDRSSH